MTDFTVILPHKRNPGNDAALSICMDCLMKNTTHDFRLLMDAAFDQPLYPRLNRLLADARTECCVITSSDLFHAPGWDVPMLEAWNPDTFVTGVVVEPGVIGIHRMNYHRDFGRHPENFRRAEFEQWCLTDAPMLDGEGWVVPVMLSRRGWLEMGGLNLALKFPEWPADQDLFDAWKATGHSIRRVRSYAYHLQRYSDVEEQEAEKRL